MRCLLVHPQSSKAGSSNSVGSTHRVGPLPCCKNGHWHRYLHSSSSTFLLCCTNQRRATAGTVLNEFKSRMSVLADSRDIVLVYTVHEYACCPSGLG